MDRFLLLLHRLQMACWGVSIWFNTIIEENQKDKEDSFKFCKIFLVAARIGSVTSGCKKLGKKKTVLKNPDVNFGG